MQDEPVSRHYGKYRGLVTSNEDPNSLGRLKANVPEVLGEVESGWALPCVPYAGKEMGFHALPEPGTGVWIEFEAGDVSRPVWTGCWWADAEIPETAKPAQKVFKTTSGHVILLNDEDKSILVRDANEQSVLLDDKGIHVADAHKQTLHLDEKGIHVLDTHKQTVEMDSKGVEIKDKNSQKITMAAAGIQIVKGGVKVNLEAGKITLTTGSQTIVMGPAAVKITAGSQSIEMGPVSTKINGGALEVM